MALKLLCSTRRSCFSFSKFLQTSQYSIRYVNDANKPKSDDKKYLYKHKEAKKFRFYVVTRYLEYMKNYDKVLETRFPKVMVVYRTFMIGLKEFYKDTKEFVKIMRLINTPGYTLRSLTRRELEIYEKLPSDMLKIAPVLILSALPLSIYVIFPLMYMFPKQLLTSHFWTDEQKDKFTREYLTNRVYYSGLVYKDIVGSCNVQNNHHWKEVVKLLRNGNTPSVAHIIACKDLFMEKPFHLIYISRSHVRHLLKIHELHKGWYRRQRLEDRGALLKAMDHAILMEGGIHNLPPQALRNACAIRGLNPNNLNEEAMIHWLQKWMAISTVVDKTSISLLLHTPVLLGFNQPSNIALRIKCKT